MAEGLLQLGDYDLTAYWHIESHDFGSENLSFQTMDTGLEVFDTDVSEGQVESTWILSPQKPTTWTVIQSNYRSLVAELRKQTNFLQLRGPNTDEIFTYDTFRSPVPSLFSTDGAAASVTHNVILELVIRRRPLARTDTLLAEVQKLSNPWPLKEGATAGRPLNWAWLSATDISAESIDNDGYHFTIATGAVRSLQQTTAVDSFASGDVVTKSFYVQASAASIVQAQAAVQFKQADGTTNVGSEHVGTLTPVGTDLVRVSVTTAAAGANTSRALVSVRFDNTAATSVDVTVQRIQAEVGSTASEFRLGIETLSNDPSGFCTFPVWNPGDANARADIFLTRVGDWQQVLVGLMEGEGLSAVAGNLYIPSSNSSIGLEMLGDLETTRVTGLGSTYTNDDALRTSTFSSGAALMQRYEARFNTSSSSLIIDTLQGHSYVVVGRYKATATGTFLLDIEHGERGEPDGSISSVTSDTVTFAPGTTPGISAGTFYDIPLGQISIPNDPGVFFVRFRAGRSSGTGNLEIDHAYLVPVDQMALIDTLGGGESIRLNAHESAPAAVFDVQLNYRTAALTQGNVPVIPPGLSFLWVSVWRGLFQEQLLGGVKESVIADTIEAWTDITPQRHQ